MAFHRIPSEKQGEKAVRLFDMIETVDSVEIAREIDKMRYLSIGMTNSYEIALEEGANIARLDTKIFG